MRSVIFIFSLFFIFSLNLSATPQEPDEIIIDGKKSNIQTSYEYPSIIEEYFISKGIPYPFELLHTANYRGHVAVFEIKDDFLYLKSFNGGVHEKYINDNKNHKIQLRTGNQISDVTRYFLKSKEMIPVSWYSGIILVRADGYEASVKCDEKDEDKKCTQFGYKNLIILKIENGKILEKQNIEEKKYLECLDELFSKKNKNKCEKIFYDYFDHIHKKSEGFQHNMKGW